MSYAGVALLHDDSDLRQRTIACVATEGRSRDANRWVTENGWELAAQPGWADAYEYALANDSSRPGWDPSVITDAMILSAVQAMLQEER